MRVRIPAGGELCRKKKKTKKALHSVDPQGHCPIMRWRHCNSRRKLYIHRPQQDPFGIKLWFIL